VVAGGIWWLYGWLMLVLLHPDVRRVTDLPRGVDDPNEDTWHLGRHVPGAQEAMDAPQGDLDDQQGFIDDNN